MRRIRPVSRLPEHGATVSPEVKITFIVNMLEAAVPLFTNKNPQNPVPSDTTAEGEGEAET